jgi:hypothetical protein
MCCICFRYFNVEDLFIDDDGDKWDMCVPCGIEETLYARAASTGIGTGDQDPQV